MIRILRGKNIFLWLVVFALLTSCAAPASETAASSEPAPTATPVSFDALLADALACFDAGDYKEAILRYQAAIEIEPKSFEAQYGLGRAYRADGQTENAVETLLVAAGLEEGTHSASYELGYAYLDAGRYKNAEALAAPLYENGDAEAGALLALVYAAESKTNELLELLKDETLADALAALAPEDGALYLGPRNEAGQKEGSGVGIYPDGYLYVGDYAADVRSGRGTWYYPGGSYYYIGEWADDAPNGQGGVYWQSSPPAVKEEGTTYGISGSTEGSLVNGLFNGTLHVVWLMDSGETHDWSFSVTNGVAGEGVVATCSICGASLTLGTDAQGIKPWA